MSDRKSQGEGRRNLLWGFQKVLSTLMPKEEDFFVLFQEMSETTLEATQVLRDLTEDISRLDYAVGKIDELEHKGDNVVHEMSRRLKTTFVTPLLMDREDILQLAEFVDDVTDHIKAVIDRFRIYDVSEPTPYARRLAALLTQAAQLLRDNMHALETIEPGSNPYCARINELENQGDALLKEALGTMFREQWDAREIIKWKDLYERMEEALDDCEDAANLVEAMVVKNA